MAVAQACDVVADDPNVTAHAIPSNNHAGLAVMSFNPKTMLI